MNPESNILSSNNIAYKTIHSIVLPVLIDGIIGLNISYWLFLFTFKLKYKYDMFLFNNFSLKYRHKYLEQLPRSNNKINLVEASGKNKSSGSTDGIFNMHEQMVSHTEIHSHKKKERCPKTCAKLLHTFQCLERF